MRLLIAVVGSVGLGAIILVFLILARLTQTWETVTRIKSHYRLLYASAVLVGVASLVRLIRIGYLNPAVGGHTSSVLSLLNDPQSWFYLCFYHTPLAIGVTISLVTTWRSWGWLLKE